MTQSRHLRRWLAFAVLLLFVPVVVLGATVATVAATGTVSVRVQGKSSGGTNLYLPVPALLIDLAVVALPLVAPADALAAARREVAPYRASVQALAAELEACPAGVLVDYRDGDEHVRISKGWRSFDIEVISDDADIRVSVPARLFGRVFDTLG